jgi:uncharacterized protein (DUF4415 family)
MMKLSALFLREKRMPKKESNIVKQAFDLKKVPQLNEEQKARLSAVGAMSDDHINYTDAPCLPDALWLKASMHLPQTKQQITLRIDAEVLDFFKHTGKRYQSRMNAVLRAYVDSHKVIDKQAT